MLSDFGGCPPSQPHRTHCISDLGQLQRVMADCASRGQSMRSRCFGHSMNGMAVPRPGEALIDLTGIRHVAWLGEGAIAAGAGLSVWEVDRHVRRFGWKLPVLNDGGAAASSIGGFIAAGGIGTGSMLYGGFWETVASLVLVTPEGEARTENRESPLFPWIFGSLGALGVVYEAVIDLVPASAARPRPVIGTLALPKLPQRPWPPHLWLTLFVTEAERDDAIACLQELAKAYPNAWRPRSSYEYFLLHRRFNPPLIFERDENFIGLGIWGDRGSHDGRLREYMALEEAFQTSVEAAGWRRYFQSELIRAKRPMERYVGSTCASSFRAFKQALDPAGLLNRFEPD